MKEDARVSTRVAGGWRDPGRQRCPRERRMGEAAAQSSAGDRGPVSADESKEQKRGRNRSEKLKRKNKSVKI